jgi:ankyrin repeat protein
MRDLILAQVTAPDGGTTPTMEMFLMAAMAGDAATLKLLAKRGDINVLDRMGMTAALNLAVLDHQTTATRLLLEAGADPDTPDRRAGSTPLQDAVNGNDLDAVRLLLKHGANVNVKTWGLEQTLVHAAAMEGPPEILAALIARGGDVNAGDARGVRPLHLAVQLKNYPAIGLLLEAGADPQAKTQAGISVLDVARRANDPKVMRLLSAETPTADPEGPAGGIKKLD